MFRAVLPDKGWFSKIVPAALYPITVFLDQLREPHLYVKIAWEVVPSVMRIACKEFICKYIRATWREI
jgi:hypothetical protein